MARAERLYEEYVVARTQLQQWIAHFRAILESQDDQLIREHRRQFGEAPGRDAARLVDMAAG